MPATLLAALLLAPPSYHGWQAVELRAESPEQRAIALELADVLPAHLRALGPIPAVVSPGSLAALGQAGIEIDVRVTDVGASMDAERARIANATVPRDFDAWFDEFKDWDQIAEQLNTYATSFPAVASLSPVGTSIEGRDIEALRVSGSTDARPAIVHVGGQHAREWIGPMVAMCVADHFVRGYGQDDEVTDLLDVVELHVVPVANPDGYVQTWGPDRLWRKNMRDGVGVDLNRNWGEGWGVEPGSSSDQGHDTYRGTGAFSEPETAALRDWIDALADPRALMDFHSLGAVILSSWAYTNTPPDDLDMLRAWGDAMERQMDAVGPHDYESLHGAEGNAVLGNASGTLPDWTHANLGIPAFTVELPPSFDSNSGWGFELPPDAIVPICEQAIDGVLEQARWVAADGALSVEIGEPMDGAVFTDPAELIAIAMDVTTPGPVEVRLEIDGVDSGLVDDTRPFAANTVQFPIGTFTLVAKAQTWDGLEAESAPVTITMMDGAGESETTGTSETGGGESSAGGDTGDEAGADETETRGLGTGTEDGDEGAVAAQGCACGIGDDGPGGGGLLLLVGVLGRRRRSRMKRA